MAKGLRYNEGKLRVELIPPEWILGLAEVMTQGAEKYEPRNWENGMEWSKCYASLLRHTLKLWNGEDIDPESGLPHALHIAWNALALYTYSKTHPEYDDRPDKHIEYNWREVAKDVTIVNGPNYKRTGPPAPEDILPIGVPYG